MNPSKSGVYSVGNAWDQIKPKQPVVNWWQIVRFLKAIPRCFRYLVDNEGWRLAKCGIGSDLLCVFCRAKIENRDHLFFKCSAAQRIWRKIKTCAVKTPLMMNGIPLFIGLWIIGKAKP